MLFFWKNIKQKFGKINFWLKKAKIKEMKRFHLLEIILWWYTKKINNFLDKKLYNWKSTKKKLVL